MSGRRGATLVARLDNVGDVLLAGPAVRAVAATTGSVVFLAGTGGVEAAAMLPGVGRVLTYDAPWVGFGGRPLDPGDLERMVDEIRRAGIEEAIILTSFHQSPLPLALLLRLAGVGRISATTPDFPGTLLDVRHPYRDELHEVEQSLDLCRAAGFDLPDGDDGRLRVSLSSDEIDLPGSPYVVVHAGASVPARALPEALAADVVRALARCGRHVVVTGSAAEAPLTERIARHADRARVTLTAGALDLDRLARLLRGADVLVAGNTGPAHLAAAVGTPVVQVFAPVVPSHRWRPWGVASIQLGDAAIPCAGCRSRICPVPEQPCIGRIDAAQVLAAVDRLAFDGVAA